MAWLFALINSLTNSLIALAFLRRNFKSQNPDLTDLKTLTSEKTHTKLLFAQLDCAAPAWDPYTQYDIQKSRWFRGRLLGVFKCADQYVMRNTQT